MHTEDPEWCAANWQGKQMQYIEIYCKLMAVAFYNGQLIALQDIILL